MYVFLVRHNDIVSYTRQINASFTTMKEKNNNLRITTAHDCRRASACIASLVRNKWELADRVRLRSTAYCATTVRLPAVLSWKDWSHSNRNFETAPCAQYVPGWTTSSGVVKKFRKTQSYDELLNKSEMSSFSARFFSCYIPQIDAPYETDMFFRCMRINRLTCLHHGKSFFFLIWLGRALHSGEGK